MPFQGLCRFKPFFAKMSPSDVLRSWKRVGSSWKPSTILLMTHLVFSSAAPTAIACVALLLVDVVRNGAGHRVGGYRSGRPAAAVMPNG